MTYLITILGYLGLAALVVCLFYSAAKFIAYLDSQSEKKHSRILDFISCHAYGCIVTLFFVLVLLTAATYASLGSKVDLEEIEERETQLAEERDAIYDSGYEQGLEDGYEEGYGEGKGDGYNDGYENGYEVGYETAEDDLSTNEIKAYYDKLCDMYGYLTYDAVMNPLLFGHYYTSGEPIYHTDWLCPDFDRSSEYICTEDPRQITGVSLCPNCSTSAYYYLDEATGIFHLAPYHLDLGTEDYLSPHVNYRMVSYDAAISNGFTPCPECGEKIE